MIESRFTWRQFTQGAALLLICASAQAQTSTPPDAVITGPLVANLEGTLTFSPQAARMFDDSTATFASQGLQVTTKLSTHQQLLSIQLTGMPVQSVVLGQNNGTQVSQIDLGGSFTINYPNDGFTSAGGQLTLDHMAVNLIDRMVYADLTDGNGVVNTRLGLFNVAGVNAMPAWTTPNELDVQLTGLTLTSAGRYAWLQALKLSGGGVSMLDTVPVMGDLRIRAVPEASTLSLMGLGLLGVAAVARRRQAARA